MPAAPETCPVCGDSVPPRARACPTCGADERSGWDEGASRYDGLDLPDEAFGGRGGDSRRQPGGLAPHWVITGLILLVALVLWLVF